MEVGVHARLEHVDVAELGELRGVGVVAEGAGDQRIEVGFTGLTGGGHQVGAGDGAKFRADEDGRAFFGAGSVIPFDVTPLRADEGAGPGGEGEEVDLVVLVGLLDAGGLEVLQDHAGEVLLPAVAVLGLAGGVDQLVVLVDAEDPVGGEGLDGEGAGDTDLLLVLVRLVVEVLVVGLGGDRRIDLLLPGDPRLPEFLMY